MRRDDDGEDEERSADGAVRASEVELRGEYLGANGGEIS